MRGAFHHFLYILSTDSNYPIERKLNPRDSVDPHNHLGSYRYDRSLYKSICSNELAHEIVPYAFYDVRYVFCSLRGQISD